MKRLRFYRKRAKMSARQLANATGTTVTSVYRYERGMREPRAEMALRFAVALGCTVEELLNDTEKETA